MALLLLLLLLVDPSTSSAKVGFSSLLERCSGRVDGTADSAEQDDGSSFWHDAVGLDAGGRKKDVAYADIFE